MYLPFVFLAYCSLRAFYNISASLVLPLVFMWSFWPPFFLYKADCTWSSSAKQDQLSTKVMFGSWSVRFFILSLNSLICLLVLVLKFSFRGNMLEMRNSALEHLADISDRFSTYSVYLVLKSCSDDTGKSVEPACRMTVWNTLSLSFEMLSSLVTTSLIFSPPVMWLVTCILKSSSPGISRSRQFEEPSNKHSTLDWQLASCSGSCSRTSGESKHWDHRSCTGSFLAFGGLWSGSKDFSGLDKLGKSPWFDRSKRLFGQSRAIWSFSPRLKHCFPTGHSAFMWLMLPQLKQRRWDFWGPLCSPKTMWPLHQGHSIRV